MAWPAVTLNISLHQLTQLYPPGRVNRRKQADNLHKGRHHNRLTLRTVVIYRNLKGASMSISAINSNALYTSALSSSSTQSTTSSSGQVAKQHHKGGGDGDFMQSLQQAFSDMGISISLQPPSGSSSSSASGDMPPPPPGGDQDGDSDTSTSSSNPMQALSTLMHDLFSAIKNQSGSSSSDSDGDNDSSTTATQPSHAGIAA